MINIIKITNKNLQLLINMINILKTSKLMIKLISFIIIKYLNQSQNNKISFTYKKAILRQIIEPIQINHFLPVKQISKI